MTQTQAQAIIAETYGINAYAIGHTESETETVIFWLYKGESEDEFKTHTINKEV